MNRTLTHFAKAIALVACGSSLMHHAQAQVSAYTFSNNTVTYTAISGTALTSGTTWDDAVQNVALPFTFTFNCVGYTSVNISTNGFVAFGATAPSTVDYSPISGTTGYAGAASAFGRDLINNAVAVTYTTVGSSPNREFVVQWTNARRYNGGAVGGDVLNFQIRLVETTNVVRFDYGTNTATSTTALTCQVGLRGASNADFANRTSTTSWSSTSAGGTNSATMTSSDLIMPSGRRYTYTPGTCGPANDLVCNATAITCGATIGGTTVNGTTTGTYEGVTTCGTNQVQPAVWYSVAGVTGTMTASLCSTAWDSKISVYSGATCSGALTCIGGVDDNGPSCVGTAASFSWASTAGTNYWIKVYGWNSNSAFNINLTCLTPPACAASPTAPTNGATGISAAGTTLSWPSVSGATGYDVYFGTTTPAPTLVSSNQAGTTYATGVLSGTTVYYWRIEPRNGVGAATGCTNWSFTTAAGAPANDNCANAIAIASLPYTSAVINNAAATDDFTASTCDGPYKNVWWTVTGICGTMTAITCTGGTNFDDEIAVYTGSCGSFTEVACNDDSGGGCTGLLAGTSWTATAGTTYYITVGSYYSLGATGNLQLNVTSTPATPSVAPTAITGTSTLCAGGSGTTLTAFGGTVGTGATIQWFTGSCGGASAGTGASISVNPPSTTTYYVRYSGTCNTTACAAVTVVVAPLPTLSCGSYGPACSDGADITLSATPVGGTWSGTGVTGNTFDPSAGTQTLTYNYTDPNYSVHSIAFAPRSTAGGGSLALGDDQVSGAVPIGFNFTFFGNTYSNLYVSSNGFITFNAASGSGCCSGQVVPDATDPNNLIAAAWDDLYPPGGGTITYLSSGTAPNRTMVVSYANVDYCCSGATPMVTTQIVLYETSNAIEIHTTSIVNITPGTMGIENAAGTVAVVVPGRNGSAWSASNEGYRFVIAGCSNSCQTTITVNPAATASAGGPYVTCGSNSVSISATANGAGSWSGGTGTFGNASNASTTYTPAIGEFGSSVTLTWTTNDPDGAGPCSSLSSNATLNVNTPATANAGGPYAACGISAVNIAATANGSGSWSGGAGTFGSATSASTTYTPDISEVGGSVTLTWTTNDPDGAGPCASVGSNATLNVNTPAAANAGGPYTTCGTSAVSIAATANGSGSWSGGAGTFGSATSASTTYTPDISEVGGSVTLTWTTNDPDGAGPCASVGSNATLNVNTPAIANAGGPYNTCGTSAVAISATTNGTGTWSGGAGSFANAANASTSYTPAIGEIGTSVVLTWTTDDPDGAGPCAAVGSTATVNVNICAYYSRASGLVSDPIWSPTPSGLPNPGLATFTSGIDMIVQATHIVTTDGNAVVDELMVDATGELVLDNGDQLNTNGNVLVNGILTANDNSALLMSSSVAQTATFANAPSFWDLGIDAAIGTTLTGNINIRGTLDLMDGNFDCTGDQVWLRSTATETGRLGPVAATASYTGNLFIERYIPAGATNWRLLGSPIAGRAVGGWQDDFVTAGYPGSTWPNFDQPVGSNILWPSIRWYDETNPGAGQNDGMVGVSNNLQSLASGQGFAAWCGDNLVTTNAFVIDLGNGSPVIASSPITLPMTYTNTGNGAVDGWNLVSNPVPSPIAFDQIARGADVEDYITYYNPANGNTAVWDIGLNSGTNGATNTIQSMQGFFLKAVGPAVTTTVDEADKVSGNGGGMFGTNNSTPDQLRLNITSGINSFSDETVVIFSEGAPNLDASDVLKYVFGDPLAPQIACVVPEQVQLAIDAYGSFAEGVTIPVSVNAGVSGEYTISLTEVGDLGLTCITLEDTELGTFTVMSSGSAYSFTMEADDDPSIARFVLHATAPIAFSSFDALCGADPDGQASVNLPVAADVTWTDGSGNVILAQSNVVGESIITGLGAGSYEVHVSTTSACGELVQSFTISAPFVLEAQGSVTNATCADSEDGSVDLLPLGGVFPYAFLWSDAGGSTTEDLTAAPGSYTVTVTDANNCTWTSAAFVIGDQGPDATLNASSTSVLVNNSVQFNGTDMDASYFWDFGDGATSTDISTEHAWFLPGDYTVTMTVDNGNCTVSSTIVITVELNTGISAGTNPEAAAWLAGDQIIVQHAFSGPALVQIDLVDATGRIVMQRATAASTARVLLPAADLPTGVWFVRMAQEERSLTLRVPVVH